MNSYKYYFYFKIKYIFMNPILYNQLHIVQGTKYIKYKHLPFGPRISLDSSKLKPND